MKKRSNLTLFQWIWRAYARSAIVPLIVIEVAFLSIYFISNAWIKGQNQQANHRQAQASLQEIVGLEAKEIQQQLSGVSYMTEMYRKQAEMQLQQPAQPLSAEDQARLAYSPDGVYYTTHDTASGGAAIFYSGYVPVGAAERDKVARLLPLQGVMKNIKLSHPLVASIYFNTHDSLNVIYPYFPVLEQYAPKMSIPTYNFYYEADKAHNPGRKTVWTDVYLDPAGHGWMASSIAPVYTGNKLEGVVGLDITVETIIHNILQLNVPWDGYAVLVGKDGTIIGIPSKGEKDWNLKELTTHTYQDAIHQDTTKPDEFNVYKRQDTQRLAQQLQGKQEGVMDLTFNNEQKVMSWATIPETGWKLIVIVEEGEIYKDINLFNQALNRVGTWMTVGLVFFYMLFFAWLYKRARIMSRQIAEPLSSINTGLQRIAGEDYGQEYPELQPSSYEVEEMRETAALLSSLSAELGETKANLLYASQEIQQSEHQLRALIDSIDDIILVTDEKGCILQILTQHETQLSMSLSSLKGQHIRCLVKEETVAEVLLAYQKVMAGQKPQLLTFQSQKSGRWYQARISYIASKGEQHQFSTVVRDITEQKQAELDLIESEERNSAIFHSALDGLLIMDAAGLLVEYNPAAEKIFGYKREDVLGKAVSDLIVPPAARQAHLRGMKRYVATNQPRILGQRIEVVSMRADGTEFPMELSVNRINTDGPPIFAAHVRDITVAKQNEQSLIQAKDEAEKANQAKSQFLSQMSHELRTPLNAVLGFAQILELDPIEPLTENQKESVAEIYKAGNHLLTLINEILDLSKIEAGTVEIDIAGVSYQQLLTECVNLLRPLAEERQLQLHTERCINELARVYVQADATKLKQVILNLFSNAIKYNREYGHIHLTYRILGHTHIRLFIHDTGYGIPEEHLERIFEPFQRHTHGDRFVEGSGIGLTLSQQLIQLMGGTIGVESEEHLGSTFWIELPLAQGAERESELPQEQHAEIKQQRAAKVKRILYIEDNAHNLKLVEKILDMHEDLQLQGVNRAAEAFSLLEHELPDVILTDIHLPDLNGFQVLKKLKSLPHTRHIPVIAISANAMPEDIERGTSSGFFAYLTKPLQLEEFIRTVRKALQSE